MIQSASTPELQTEFLRRIAHKPYFESTLGTHLHLFGNHPASGWAFYLLPGSAVLELRGGSAVLCGALPGGGRPGGIDGLSPLSTRRHPANRAPADPARLAACRAADAVGAAKGPYPAAAARAPGGACPGQSAVDAAGQPPCLCRERRRGRRVLLRGLHGAGPRGGHLPRAAAQRQTRLHGGLLRAERYRELHGRGRDRPRVAGQGAGTVFDCRAGE